ncbi:hypothetical protein V8G54_011678 [Vigna mungo]|uniref:Uncharacterized protein n=1 Tax=Vigna mungo TaxID=3915 RepID=A0AAQ3NS27_VIGMU
MGELRAPTRRKQTPKTLSPSKTKSPEQTSDPNGTSPPKTPSQNTNNPKCHKNPTPLKIFTCKPPLPTITTPRTRSHQNQHFPKPPEKDQNSEIRAFSHILLFQNIKQK